MNTFPVHLLPDRAFLWVLRTMENYDQLAYSLCSEKAKKAIKSLNLNAERIVLDVSDLIALVIDFDNDITFSCSFYYDYNFPNNQITARKDTKVFVENRAHRAPIEWKWNFQNFDFKEWLHHFCEVLNHPKIDDIMFDYEEIDDTYIEPIQKAIKGLQIGCLSVIKASEPGFAETALETFPTYEELYIEHIPFPSHEVHKMDKLLIQNLKSVLIHEAQEIKIDRVLVSNSERIELTYSFWSEKDLNKLLKLWIRGCNPRLKYFCTLGQGPLLGKNAYDQDAILKRIKYKQVPLDSEELYREHLYGDFYDETKMAGGFRIRRIDGTTAVVVVSGIQFKLIVE